MVKKFIYACLLALCMSIYVFADDSKFSFFELKKACNANAKSEKCQQLLKEANQKCQNSSDSYACKKLHEAEVKKCQNNPDTKFCKEYLSNNK
ncbi:MAG: hypothetical protein AAGB35_02280 [Pseudomonadota bacterium]